MKLSAKTFLIIETLRPVFAFDVNKLASRNKKIWFAINCSPLTKLEHKADKIVIPTEEVFQVSSQEGHSINELDEQVTWEIYWFQRYLLRGSFADTTDYKMKIDKTDHEE